jgi:hypothetical protein
MPLSTIIQLHHGRVLLVKETGVTGENHRQKTLSHNVISSTSHHERGSISQR